MNRFRAVFASLIVVAVVTSFFASWGVVVSLQTNGTPLSASSTTETSASTTYAVESSASTATTVTTATATATITATSTTTTTTTSVTTTAAPGQVVTTTITGPGGGVTTTATTTGSAAYGFGAGLTTSSGGVILRETQTISLLLAPVAWVAVGGAWMWRGRVRSRYTELGFGSDVFELFMKMKGGATRIKVLNMLDTPKDRLQLAQELGVDWKTVDRHVQILDRYGFVRERAAFGTVRLYEVTPIGKMLLNLFDDLERTDGLVVREAPQQHSGDKPET